ncbi:hypothetical protein [Enterococcus faecalis]|uniref:hypothetical protein n=1 Tax=Enterococcus faecalis TaxID=1351 RepID=UPI00242DDFF1|nr:hypothetical protein [Enterococcus faecalis]
MIIIHLAQQQMDRFLYNVQDEYNASYSWKKFGVQSFIDRTQSSEQEIFLNYVSLSSGRTAWSSPYYYASYLNSYTGDYLEKTGAGWIAMDYSGGRWSPNLTNKVIRKNILFLKIFN